MLEPARSVRKVLFSRAYIDFSDPAFVYEFKAKFDGHTFVSSKGNQYKCSVEYAPFQKVPAPPKKRNPLEGTIEQGACTLHEAAWAPIGMRVACLSVVWHEHVVR